MAKLTEEEKRKLRVLVAKDVIKAIDAGKLQTRTGVYVGLEWDKDDVVSKMEGKTSKQQAVIAQEECEVCAMGACFLSLVKVDNKFDLRGKLDKSEDGLGKEEVVGRLKAVFSPKQLALIECAFEGKNASRVFDSPEEVERAAVEFGEDAGGDEDALYATMKNIVKNKGFFLPFRTEDFI